MFEIIFVIAATSGNRRAARARGGKPWLWGNTAPWLAIFLVPLPWLLFLLALGLELQPKGRQRERSTLVLTFRLSPGSPFLAFLRAPSCSAHGLRQPDGMLVLSELQVSEISSTPSFVSLQGSLTLQGRCRFS